MNMPEVLLKKMVTVMMIMVLLMIMKIMNMPAKDDDHGDGVDEKKT